MPTFIAVLARSPTVIQRSEVSPSRSLRLISIVAVLALSGSAMPANAATGSSGSTRQAKSPAVGDSHQVRGQTLNAAATRDTDAFPRSQFRCPSSPDITCVLQLNQAKGRIFAGFRVPANRVLQYQLATKGNAQIQLQQISQPRQKAADAFYGPVQSTLKKTLVPSSISKGSDGSHVFKVEYLTGGPLDRESLYAATLFGIDSRTGRRAPIVVVSDLTRTLPEVDMLCGTVLTLATSMRDTSLAVLDAISVTGSLVSVSLDYAGVEAPPSVKQKLLGPAQLAGRGSLLIRVLDAPTMNERNEIVADFVVSEVGSEASTEVATVLALQDAEELVEWLTTYGQPGNSVSARAAETILEVCSD